MTTDYMANGEIMDVAAEVIESLVAERDALRALLLEIWAEFENDEWVDDALLDKIHAALKDAP